jgi:hypothetical protein
LNGTQVSGSLYVDYINVPGENITTMNKMKARTALKSTGASKLVAPRNILNHTY